MTRLPSPTREASSKRPPRQTDPLLHSHDPQPLRRTRRDGKPDAVVGHRQADTTAGRCHLDRHPTGAGMPDDVAQRRLRHVVEARRHRGRNRLGQVADPQIDANRAVAPKVGHVGPQRRLQAQVVQDRRVQAVGEAVHIVRQLHQPVPDGPEALRGRARGAGHPGLQRLDVEGQHREPLVDVVVQLTRDAPPLVVLGREQSAGQHLQLGLTPFELGLLPPQGVLRPLAVGHVPPDRPVVVVLLLVPDKRHAEADVQQVPVPPPEPQLHIARAAVRAGRLESPSESGGAARIMQIPDRAPEHLRPPVPGRAQQRGVALHHALGVDGHRGEHVGRVLIQVLVTRPRRLQRLQRLLARLLPVGIAHRLHPCIQMYPSGRNREPGDLPSSQAPRDTVSCTKNGDGARTCRPREDMEARWTHRRTSSAFAAGRHAVPHAVRAARA